MSNKDQPAFSQSKLHKNSYTNEWEGGLTKREYFAGLAMQGLLAYPRGQEGETPWSQTVALWAIEAADALLAELEKTA